MFVDDLSEYIQKVRHLTSPLTPQIIESYNFRKVWDLPEGRAYYCLPVQADGINFVFHGDKLERGYIGRFKSVEISTRIENELLVLYFTMTAGKELPKIEPANFGD
jgi:hypothetical protein